MWICLGRLAVVFNEFVRGRERERNGSRSERSEGSESRRTNVGVSKEWIASMHARDGRC